MRRRKLIGVAALAVLLAAGAFVLWPRTGRITQENFVRIEVGMSHTEVVAILGPPGDYRTIPTTMNPRSLNSIEVDDMPLYRSGCCCASWGPPDKSWFEATWVGNEGLIQIAFESGVVAGPHVFCGSGLGASGAYPSKSFLPTARRQQSLLDDLRWQAKRQWPRLFSER